MKASITLHISTPVQSLLTGGRPGLPSARLTSLGSLRTGFADRCISIHCFSVRWSLTQSRRYESSPPLVLPLIRPAFEVGETTVPLRQSDGQSVIHHHQSTPSPDNPVDLLLPHDHPILVSHTEPNMYDQRPELVGIHSRELLKQAGQERHELPLIPAVQMIG